MDSDPAALPDSIGDVRRVQDAHNRAVIREAARALCRMDGEDPDRMAQVLEGLDGEPSEAPLWVTYERQVRMILVVMGYGLRLAPGAFALDDPGEPPAG